jgi:hypothetical protein
VYSSDGCTDTLPRDASIARRSGRREGVLVDLCSAAMDSASGEFGGRVKLYEGDRGGGEGRGSSTAIDQHPHHT